MSRQNGFTQFTYIYEVFLIDVIFCNLKVLGLL